MIKPYKRKIENTLAFIRDKTKDTFISPVGMHNIFFHIDVTHLNNYGRPVCYENYSVNRKGFIIGEYLATLFVKQKFDFDFDRDLMSVSDIDQIEEILALYANYSGFNYMVESFNNIRNFLDQSIELEQMFYKGKYTKDQIEEQIWMITESAKSRKYDDFNSEDLK